MIAGGCRIGLSCQAKSERCCSNNAEAAFLRCSSFDKSGGKATRRIKRLVFQLFTASSPPQNCLRIVFVGVALRLAAERERSWLQLLLLCCKRCRCSRIAFLSVEQNDCAPLCVCVVCACTRSATCSGYNLHIYRLRRKTFSAAELCNCSRAREGRVPRE